MMTTKSLTESQIRTVRAAAIESGDYCLAAICDLALDGEIDGDDYSTLSRSETIRVTSMTRDEAYATIVEAL